MVCFHVQLLNFDLSSFATGWLACGSHREPMMPWLGNPQLGKQGVKKKPFECPLINKLTIEIQVIFVVWAMQILNITVVPTSPLSVG